MPHTPGLQRIFLGWDRPLLHLAAERLFGGGEKRLLDLSGTVVVVPTSHSGRRVRERLAWLAAQNGGGVLPPEVCTPERLLRRFFPTGVVEPSPSDRIALWAALLREAGQEERSPLFPGSARAGDGTPGAGGNGRPAIEIGPLLTAAQRLSQVQHLLGEAGLSMADVADSDGPFRAHLDEPGRWIALARLERRFDELMAEHGLADSNRLRREVAEQAVPPPEWQRVVLAGVLDPLPLAIRLLERFAARVPVEVWLHAPDGMTDAFDGWGRPLDESWTAARLDVDEQSIRLVADCTHAAVEAAKVCLASPGGTEQTALCVPAGDEIPVVVKELERAGLAAYDPGGRPLRLHRTVGLLTLLWDLLPEPSAEAVAGLLRHPDYLGGGVQGPGSGGQGVQEAPGALGDGGEPTAHCPLPTAVFSSLDDLRAEHLPATLADIERVVARRLADIEREGAAWKAGAPGRPPETDRGMESLAHACRSIRSHVERLGGGSSVGRASLEILAEIYRDRVLEPADSDDRVFTVAARALTELLGDLDEGVAARLLPDPADRIALAQLQLSSLAFQPERDPGAVDILGWLELLFEDAPGLIVCGMNDGAVPETVTADPFLPDSLRKRLGLRTNDDRMARDACLLAAAAQSRKTNGRGPAASADGAGNGPHDGLLLLVEKTSPTGDPKRPSRLLFLCPDEQLPARVLRLFGEVEQQARPVPRTSPWKLRPRIAPVPVKLRVTSFAAWLACPFRFYLSSVLGMESVDDRAEEMDPMGFGTLIHEALQALGNDRSVGISTDVETVRDFLRATVLRLARERFGNGLPPALVAQVEAASQRLSAAAAVHVQSVLDGWRIVEVEKRLDAALALDDAPANMPNQRPLTPAAAPATIDPRLPRAESRGPSTIRVSGRIDRIERHQKTGRYRILDYKTGDSPMRPDQAHLGPVREGTVPEAVVEIEGKDRAWTDLQLPLYRALLASELGQDAEVGYFLLPKAVSETRIELWPGLTPAMVDSALSCARGIASRIRNREFWPPSSPAELDELYGAAVTDLDMEWLQRLLGREP